MKIKISLFLFVLCLSPLSLATVGGPQQIEVLGYEVKEQKLYLLRHYLDGRGRLPQLYYYHFKSQKPNQLVQVHSLYIHPKTKKIDYDQHSKKFDQDIAQIKKRLTPVAPLAKQNIQLKRIRTDKSTAPAWHDSRQNVPKWTYLYRVQSGPYQTSIHQAVSYTPDLVLNQAYRIPQQDKLLVTVKYLGIPFETGYHIEDPVLLSR